MCLVTIGAEARTGLLSMGMLGFLLWLRSSKKIISGVALGVLLVGSIPFLPASFTERMSTLETFNSDKSASTRIAVWKWTLDYVSENPFGGGFHIYKINNVTVEMSETTVEGNTTDRVDFSVKDRARAFHSAYFEVLGELGIPGLAIWLSIVTGALYKARAVVKRERKLVTPLLNTETGEEREMSDWARDFGRSMSITILVYLTGALFVGIATQPTLYTMISLLVSVWYLRSDHLANVIERGRKASFKNAHIVRPSTVLA
nr:O-antigen ligase family protein [Pacificimonas pallii]